MPEMSFQEPALTEHLQYKLLKGEIGDRSSIPELILTAIGFDSLAIFVELRAICGKQGRRNGDFAADVVFRIDELEFTSQHRIDFFVTGNVDDENIVPYVPQDIQRAFKPISVKHVRDDNSQASPARLCAIRVESCAGVRIARRRHLHPKTTNCESST